MSNYLGVETNSKVVHIGNLFKNKKENVWNIYVWFSPKQTIKSTKFSNLPTLSRGKVINRTDAADEDDTSDNSFTFAQDYILEKCRLGEFKELSKSESIKNKDGEQNAFKIKQKRLPITYIPQLELARALFLSNSYMCRACLMTTALSFDFEVRRDLERDHADIHVRLLDLFPLKAFDHHGTNLMLSWILTNKDARKSYTSICANFNKEKISNSIQDTWNFSFEPPPMMKWKLHARGRFSRDKKSYLVEEIVGIEINSDMPKTVSIRHPNFLQKDSANGVIQTPASPNNWNPAESNIEIDDETASDQSETIIIEAERSFVRFLKPCRVRKELIRSEARTIVPGTSNESGSGRRRVSTGEPHVLGTLPAASVGGRRDESDPDLEFSTRFTAFNEMLKILCEEHGCTIIKSQTLRLNAVGRSRAHFLSDGSPRVIKAVVIRRNQTDSILLEIDTSDTSSLTATKVIFFPESSQWERQFFQIRIGVIRMNLTWPAVLFDNYYGKNGHKSIPHPKHDGSEIGNIPVNALDGWARRILKRLP